MVKSTQLMRLAPLTVSRPNGGVTAVDCYFTKLLCLYGTAEVPALMSFSSLTYMYLTFVC